MRNRAKARWDELATAAMFSSFGIVSLFRVQEPANIPLMFNVIFDVELILAGLFIIIGVLHGSYTLRILGYLLYAFGLTMLGVLLLVLRNSPFFLLALGFAVQSIAAVRVIDRDRKARKNIAQLIRNVEPRGE